MSEYVHRNGETEPPTVEGWYWFDGLVGLLQSHSRRLYDVYEGQTGIMHAFVAGRYSFRLDREMQGRWWGPVEPPWEVGR